MGPSDQQTAFLIYQSWLDRVASALWSSEFSAVADCHALPALHANTRW